MGDSNSNAEIERLKEENERLCTGIKILEKVIENKEKEISRYRVELCTIRLRINCLLGEER